MTLELPSLPEPIRSGDLHYVAREPNADHQLPRCDCIYETVLPRSEATYSAFPDCVPPDVQAILLKPGQQPYSHQAEVARLALEHGLNIALITQTASGKTVAFLSAVLSRLVLNPTMTGMMVYPMNALAMDQQKVLKNLGFTEAKDGLLEAQIGGTIIRAGILTGETQSKARTAIRARANLIITNHVAIHHSVLEQCNRTYKDQTSWARFLRNLGIMVLDEGHFYNGVEGTNAALTFRRLFLLVRKLAGNPPQVIMASATIGNPEEHARNLTGLEPWAVVDKSGAASHGREISILRPGQHPAGFGRWPASRVAVGIAAEEVRNGRRVLIFCPSRTGTEKVADLLNEALKADVAIHFHAGIPAEVKRVYLERILSGAVQVVCATSALELGVDIGGMDTVILVGHPGDHASFHQRIGRVGRTSPGRVFLILDESQHPINAYLEEVPEAIHWAPESRSLFPENRVLGPRHAACALLETRDPALVMEAFPNLDEAAIQAAAGKNPHKVVAMVGLGNFGIFKAVDPKGQAIQELSGETALLYWHADAAIRSPWGSFQRVSSVDLQLQTVYTVPAALERGRRLYTTPQITTFKDAVPGTLVPLVGLPLNGAQNPRCGDFDVRRITMAFFESQQGGAHPDQTQTRPVHPDQRNPPIGFVTRGVQFALDNSHPLAEAMQRDIGGLMAVRDALGLTVPLLVKARGRDVPVEISAGEDTLDFFIFDMAEGGMGWAEHLVLYLDRWLALAGQALLSCSCNLKGCPRCSLSPVIGAKRRRLAEALIAAGQGHA